MALPPGWEWAWLLVRDPHHDGARRTFVSLWRSWRAGTLFGRWDGWSPYVVSVRAWVLADLFDGLVAGTAGEGAFLEDLALHAASWTPPQARALALGGAS